MAASGIPASARSCPAASLPCPCSWFSAARGQSGLVHRARVEKNGHNGPALPSGPRPVAVRAQRGWWSRSSANEARVLTLVAARCCPRGRSKPSTGRWRRAAHLGRAADQPAAGLCRAALHLRRPRPAATPRAAAWFVAYLALTRASAAPGRCARPAGRAGTASFPWEDWRRHAGIARANRAAAPALDRRRLIRPRGASDGSGSTSVSAAGAAWNEELVLERYELLYEAGLVPEAARSRRPAPAEARCRARDGASTIAASWRPASAGCAARSNTVRSCSS